MAVHGLSLIQVLTPIWSEGLGRLTGQETVTATLSEHRLSAGDTYNPYRSLAICKQITPRVEQMVTTSILCSAQVQEQMA